MTQIQTLKFVNIKSRENSFDHVDIFVGFQKSCFEGSNFYYLIGALLISIVYFDMQRNLVVNQVQQLNLRLLTSTQEVNHWRLAYNRAVNTKQQVQNALDQKEEEHRNLQTQLERLQENYDRVKDELSKFKPSCNYKKYRELNSKSGKVQRKRQCRKMFHNLLGNIPDITRANINLKLGSDNLHVLWKSNANNANQAVNATLRGTDDDLFDVNENDIFDDEGNYVTPYLRSIIYVMDKHKISHEAYHETRMVTKGFMPPVHVIKKAKAIMSEEIEYIKHPTVCIRISRF